MEHFITAEQYQELKKAWKILSDAKDIQSYDILVYNILRGLSADRGFTFKVTNIQGNNPWWAFQLAKGFALWNLPKINFKSRYGIDLPTELLTKIKEVQYG